MYVGTRQEKYEIATKGIHQLLEYAVNDSIECLVLIQDIDNKGQFQHRNASDVFIVQAVLNMLKESNIPKEIVIKAIEEMI